MTQQIEVILFDMGGTLRSTTPKSWREKKESIRQIIELLGADISAEALTKLLSARARAYKRWSEKTLVELNESDLWSKWMLPDWPGEQIDRIAIQLNQFYREAIRTGKIFPETYDVVLELFRRGYRLGIVSNTTSSDEVPAILNGMRLTGCFEIVMLSAVAGKRKPDPFMLVNAGERMGASPEKCAYIGNSPDRDVVAARKAGFCAILLGDPIQPQNKHFNDPLRTPDQYVRNLKGLLDVFPARTPVQPAKVYNVSLSTMWFQKNFPTLSDFFESARRAGFSGIELNHKIDSGMLAGIDPGRHSFSSVHEPCPADISVEILKKRDWLISSLDEECRREGVKTIQRSIEKAHQLGAPIVVVHAGHAQFNHGLEKQLQVLYNSGLKDTDEYGEIQEQMIRNRGELAGAGLESVEHSLLDLLGYANRFGIRLGLENRYHFMEYPSSDELGTLLELASPEQLGFIFDVGHAQHLSRLGFYPHDEWLKRFAPRIIGTHLHDIIGLQDHFAPGLGNVNYNNVASYLPENSFRTCECLEFNTPEQVTSGLKYLYEHGCIRNI
jgi:HAD superfamily hydrolase (TIGR01549 family)